MRKQTWSYVPLIMPLWIVMVGHRPHGGDCPDHQDQAVRLDGADGVSHQGLEAGRGQGDRELGWKPLPLEEGISRFLAARRPSAHAERGATRERARARAADREAASC